MIFTIKLKVLEVNAYVKRLRPSESVVHSKSGTKEATKSEAKYSNVSEILVPLATCASSSARELSHGLAKQSRLRLTFWSVC